MPYCYLLDNGAPGGTWRQCVYSLDIPSGFSGRFRLYGQDGNTTNGDLFVRRASSGAIECDDDGNSVDEVCSDISAGSVEVIVTAPIDLSYYLYYDIEEFKYQYFREELLSPPLNQLASDIDAGSACVFDFGILMKSTTGTRLFLDDLKTLAMEIFSSDEVILLLLNADLALVQTSIAMASQAALFRWSSQHPPIL